MSMPVGSTLRARALTYAAESIQDTVRDVLYVVFRHKWKMMAVFGTIVLGGGLYTLTSPEIYEARAQLLMRVGSDEVAGGGSQQMDGRHRESELHSNASIITSRLLIERLVDDAGQEAVMPPPREPGLKQDINVLLNKAKRLPATMLASMSPATALPPREVAIREVQQSVQAMVERNANVITVTYESRSPELAESALNRLVDLYLERHIEVYASQATPNFFESQSAELQATLAALEAERDAFRAEYGISNIDSQKEALLQSITSTELRRNEAAADERAAAARNAELESALQNRPSEHVTSETTGLRNETAERLKAELTGMQLRESDLAARYPDSYRPLIELREQITQVATMLAQEQESLTTVTRSVDATHQQLSVALESAKAELRAHAARKESLDSEIATLNARLAELITRESRMTQMDRDVLLAEKEYQDYREGLQRARIASAMNIDKISNIGVLQPATVTPHPVKPRVARNIALALFLGVFAAFALAFGLEYLGSRLHTPDDVERRLRLPVLAVIGEKEFNKCL